MTRVQTQKSIIMSDRMEDGAIASQAQNVKLIADHQGRASRRITRRA